MFRRRHAPLLAALLLPAAVLATPAYAAVQPAGPQLTTGAQLVSLVDSFAGTDTNLADEGTGGGSAGQSPAAAAPFGMMELGPTTTPDATNYQAGYTYGDTKITGFSLNRFQGGGCTGFGDLPITPTTTSVTTSPAKPLSFDLDDALTSTFDHAHESASPGSYAVTLNPGTGNAIGVQLAAATRAGVASFSFPGQSGTLVLNAGGSKQADYLSDVTIDPATHTATATIESGRFCEQPNLYTVHVAIAFDQPFASYATWTKQLLTEGSTSASDSSTLPLGYGPGLPTGTTFPGDPSGTAQAGAVLRFASKDVTLHIGMSYVSQAAAQQALTDEVGTQSVQQVAARTAATWAGFLGRVRVAGGSDANRRELATELYQSLLSPQVMSDENGDFPGLSGKTENTGGGDAYTLMSLWDEYRTHAQLLALIAPKQAADMVRTLLQDEKSVGYLPRWPILGTSPTIMVGDPAVPFMADIAAFGGSGVDEKAVVAAAKHGLASNGVNDAPVSSVVAGQSVGSLGQLGYAERPAEPVYDELHYVPVELDTTTNTTGGFEVIASPDIVWGSTSLGLEYASADFSAARLAGAVCDPADASTFATRSGWWQQNFDSATGYVEPRLTTGLFTTGSETGSAHGFVEGDGSQYTFMVPFDVAGLATDLGGRTAMVKRLDALFTKLNDGPTSAYAFLGNEPGLTTPYYYDWAGRPDRTTDVVRAAMATLYAPTPDGYPGNTDGGTMNSWWVWGALGLYPAVPGDDVLTVSAPVFPEVQLALPNGKTATITTTGPGPYVTGASWNHTSFTRTWLRYADLARGGTLALTTAAKPATWGTAAADAPPSYAAGATLPCGWPASLSAASTGSVKAVKPARHPARTTTTKPGQGGTLAYTGLGAGVPVTAVALLTLALGIRRKRCR